MEKETFTTTIPDHSCQLLCAWWYDYWHYTVCYYNHAENKLMDDENPSELYDFSIFDGWMEFESPDLKCGG